MTHIPSQYLPIPTDQALLYPLPPLSIQNREHLFVHSTPHWSPTPSSPPQGRCTIYCDFRIIEDFSYFFCFNSFVSCYQTFNFDIIKGKTTKHKLCHLQWLCLLSSCVIKLMRHFSFVFRSRCFVIQTQIPLQILKQPVCSVKISENTTEEFVK